MSKEFLTPKKIITGKGAIEASIQYLAAMGKKPLIVTGHIVSELDCFQMLLSKLACCGLECVVFKEITSEPTDVMIEKGLAVYQENDCDFLIGMGGGSPIDAIKAIAVRKACGGKLSDYMRKEISGAFPPMAAIPTTAGTGSEATKFTVITDAETDVKMLLKGAELLPDLAIVDSACTLSSPKPITASTGLDALTHAVEAYTSKQAQPLSDALALSAVKRIFTYLPIAYRDGNNEKARYEMSIAALEAGICINNSSVTIVHGMSRPIGALFHVPHGLSNAMLLCRCMDFVKDGATERFAELSRAAGIASPADSDAVAADCLITGLFELCRCCEVPSIAEYGIDIQKFQAAIPKMTSDALASGSPANTRKEIRAEDITALYQALL